MIALIAAVARNRVIGADNKLLWHLSADLRRFKKLTMGHPVVMGRKTFESIGRPLPGRRNIVLTNDLNWTHAGVEVAHSLDGLLVKMNGPETWFVIGGAQIYEKMLPHADKMYLTHIDYDPEGDAYFPVFDPNQFVVSHSEQHSADDFFSHSYSFVDYVRRR